MASGGERCQTEAGLGHSQFTQRKGGPEHLECEREIWPQLQSESKGWVLWKSMESFASPSCQVPKLITSLLFAAISREDNYIIFPTL